MLDGLREDVMGDRDDLGSGTSGLMDVEHLPDAGPQQFAVWQAGKLIAGEGEDRLRIHPAVGDSPAKTEITLGARGSNAQAIVAT